MSITAITEATVRTPRQAVVINRRVIVETISPRTTFENVSTSPQSATFPKTERCNPANANDCSPVSWIASYPVRVVADSILAVIRFCRAAESFCTEIAVA
jgi:hypothetical protein